METHYKNVPAFPFTFRVTVQFFYTFEGGQFCRSWLGSVLLFAPCQCATVILGVIVTGAQFGWVWTFGVCAKRGGWIIWVIWVRSVSVLVVFTLGVLLIFLLCPQLRASISIVRVTCLWGIFKVLTFLFTLGPVSSAISSFITRLLKPPCRRIGWIEKLGIWPFALIIARRFSVFLFRLWLNCVLRGVGWLLD